jgi:hypothetical protein
MFAASARPRHRYRAIVIHLRPRSLRNSSVLLLECLLKMGLADGYLAVGKNILQMTLCVHSVTGGLASNTVFVKLIAILTEKQHQLWVNKQFFFSDCHLT